MLPHAHNRRIVRLCAALRQQAAEIAVGAPTPFSGFVARHALHQQANRIAGREIVRLQVRPLYPALRR